MDKKILPYQRIGSWISSYSFYYECAYKSYFKYLDCLHELNKEETRLRDSYIDETKDSEEEIKRLLCLIDFETNALQQEAFMAATTTHLYICITIEAFINDYGTKRLREDFYKKNIERMGITEKLAVLWLIAFNKKLDSDDPLIKKIRFLFDRRNRLVHSKLESLNQTI